jgi:DNA-binding response OmpR family regulator
LAIIDQHPVILVIEGDQSTRNGLMAVLHHASFAVVAATTGAQALATVESRRVSLVLAGSHLRGLSGADVLRKLREREARQRLPPVPFITLAGESDLAPTPWSARVASPVTLGELLMSVNELLNRQPAVPTLP